MNLPAFCWFYHYTADDYWSMNHNDYRVMLAWMNEYQRQVQQEMERARGR
jgi:hypothetical protein